MPIEQTERWTFNQKQIAVMRGAMDQACLALRFAHPSGVDPHTRRLLAKVILSHAAAGELSAIRLAAAALATLEPAQAAYADLPAGSMVQKRARAVMAASGTSEVDRLLSSRRSAT